MQPKPDTRLRIHCSRCGITTALSPARDVVTHCPACDWPFPGFMLSQVPKPAARYTLRDCAQHVLPFLAGLYAGWQEWGAERTWSAAGALTGWLLYEAFRLWEGRRR